MKVLMLNGSPHEKGCTYTALNEVAKTLNDEGIDTEIVWSGNGAVRDCIGCGACRKAGKCVFDDDLVNDFVEKAKTADGFVFGSPTYYAHPSGRVLSILNRVFYSGSVHLARKPGASVVSARRAGTTATLDVLNKYFTINRMPVVSSQYWNMVHGNTPEEVLQDKEGLQTMRLLAREMACFIKMFHETGMSVIKEEEREKTNFIR